MNEKIKKICIILISMGVISLCACGGKKDTSFNAKSDYNVDKVMITLVKSPFNVPTLIEKSKKSFETAFEQKGISMEYSDITSGSDQTIALASGDIHFLNCVGGASVIISAVAGNDIKILSMYTRAPKAYQMYAKDDSINNPYALKGKTVAGPKGTTLHELLVAYLKTGGLTIDDVNYVSMSIPNARAALEGGSVDVALLAGVNAYNAEKEGFYKVTDGEGLTQGVCVTATSEKFYKENKELVDTFLEVHKETLDFMKNNYDEMIDIAAKEADIDRNVAEEMYKLYEFDDKIYDEDIKSLDNTQDFLYDNGMIEKKIDVRSLCR